MITAVIQNGRQTAAIELPRDWCSLQYWLAQIDIREQPEHIPIGFDSDKAISVTLAAKSDIGKALTALFTEKNTLGEANVCTHMTENARMEIREELEQGLLYEQYTSPQEVMDSSRLKNHIDKIVETGTNPAYGIPSDSVTYKVVQITIDGDIAFAVIYGG